MKEASGELSMTAIAVVAIAAIGVLFTTLIYPNIRRSLEHSQNCSVAYGCVCGPTDQTCSCFYDDGTTDRAPITCDNPNFNG